MVDPEPLEIDLVITWVNGSDPIHQEERAKILSHYKTRDKTAIISYRWTDHNEIYFCVSSALRFASWIRKIFIVTSFGQRPAIFGDHPHPKIQYVDDIYLLPAPAIPTFSSHALEANLWRIPGLSEHFLYMNDDMFFADYVTPTDFFSYRTGFPRMIPGEPLPMATMSPFDFMPGWHSARCNNSLLLNRLFGACFPSRREAKHQVRAVLKSVFEQMWGIGRIRKELEATTLTRFRHYKNVEPIGLAQQCAQQWGKAGEPNLGLLCRYITWTDETNWDYELQRLERGKQRPHLLCVNDEQQLHKPHLSIAFQTRMQHFLLGGEENGVADICHQSSRTIGSVERSPGTIEET